MQHLPAERTSFYRSRGKRFVDVCVSTAGLLALAPLLGMIAILVKLSSRGPAFFRQERVGLDGRIFQIIKFRSMVDGAERKGPCITSSGDRRVTRLGAILRKLKLDELPQMWNVLKGDMSFVGPRPELPVYVSQYSPTQRQVLAVRPGITDIASIRYRHEEALLGQARDPEAFYREAILNHKLALNLEYIARMSLSFDVMLTVMTLKSVFSFLPGPQQTAATAQSLYRKSVGRQSS